jgi:hypothetical protein
MKYFFIFPIIPAGFLADPAGFLTGINSRALFKFKGLQVSRVSRIETMLELRVIKRVFPSCVWVATKFFQTHPNV